MAVAVMTRLVTGKHRPMYEMSLGGGDRLGPSVLQEKKQVVVYDITNIYTSSQWG